MKILQLSVCILSIACVNGVVAKTPAQHTHLAAVMSGTDTSKSSSEITKASESTIKKDMKAAKQYLSDSEITAKVKETFIREKLFGKESISAMGIKVKTKQGIVTLSGKAASQDEVDTAIKLAKSVEGVKDVKSSIKVKSAKNSR